MKNLMLILALLFSFTYCTGQQKKVKIYPKGLLYNDTTMNQLAHIVDSLNLKFKVCDLNKTFYSPYQGKAHYFRLTKGNFKQAMADIENNISYEDFIKKYPSAGIEKDLLVVKTEYTDYMHQHRIEFISTSLNENENGYEIGVNPEEFAKNPARKWVYKYYDKGTYSEEELYGFYFISALEKKPLPEKYARMVQYSECMIDTNTQLYTGKSNLGRFDEEKTTKADLFFKYVNEQTDAPVYDDKDYDAYRKKQMAWDSVRFNIIDKKLAHQQKFKNLLKEAVEEAKEKGSGDAIEEYIARYYSKKVALDLKRNRTVIGYCSMDDGPRRHAVNIAVLSAEAVSWETFMRAHLDIMNDRFERMSDGSYAQEGRKTHIRELEELDINVPDLLFGISFRLENPGENHYYGSIGRLGRALSETKNAKEIETKMLEIIKDNSLDDYNRILMYYLYLNYNYYLKDEAHKKQNIDNLKLAVKELPAYLSSRIKFKE